MEVPSWDELFATLRSYREFLKLEYPRYYWNPNYEPWIPADINISQPGDHFPRALAKAIYGRSYYDDPRPLLAELNLFFAKSVESSNCQNVVCIVLSYVGDR